MAAACEVVAGLELLQQMTEGDPGVRIAILDGPVDLSHPIFSQASLQPTCYGDLSTGEALRHGTQIASVIFGGKGQAAKGIAPNCSGILIPIFSDDGDRLLPCSELDLARAISMATQQRAHIINISGGKFTFDNTTHPLLESSIKAAVAEGILIVAAAGNDGCSCHHLPSYHPDVLTIGSSTSSGTPADFSNWGETYRSKGLLVSGEDISVALPGGGETEASGTSISAAVASGIVALLLSAAKTAGIELSASEARALLQETALKCDPQTGQSCERYLAGHIDIVAAMRRIGLIHQEVVPSGLTDGVRSSVEPMDRALTPVILTSTGGVASMSTIGEQSEIQPQCVSTSIETENKEVRPSACGCGGMQAPTQLVYVLGRLSVDFPSRTRREAIAIQMPENQTPHHDKDLLEYFKKKPWEAQNVQWVLSRNEAPLYVIRPNGPFASRGYELLREFLDDQLKYGLVLVAIAGRIVGQAKLASGHTVPVVEPDLEGMYDWENTKLIESVGAKRGDKEYDAIENFLRRMESAAQNVGIAPQDRALNYAVSNLLFLVKGLTDIFKEGYIFDQVEIARSALCHPDAECFKVQSIFFSQDLAKARRVIEYTVDVSGVIPIKLAKEVQYSIR